MSSVFKFFGEIGLKSDEVEKGLKKVSSDSESTASKITATFKKAAIAIGSIFAAGKIIDFGKMAVGAAAEAEEFAGAFEQVFKGFEDEAEASMQNVTDTIKASEGRFKESFLQIAGFGKASGMDTAESIELSNRAVVAAADYAAMYGGTLEDTAGSLQSFLKGNYANDAALGVSATEFTRNAAAVEMYGAEFNELTETQKQWVLLDMVEKANETSGAMGQAAREVDSYANTMGELKNAWNEFLIIVGGPILKAVIPVIQLVTKSVQWLAEAVVPAGEALGEFLGSFSEPFETAYGLIKSLFDLLNGGTEIDQIISLQKLGLTRSDIDKFLSFVNGFKSFIDLAKKAIGKEFKKLKDWFDDFVDIFKEIDFELLMEKLSEFGELGLETFQKIAEGLKKFMEPMLTYWKNIFNIIKDLFKGLVTAFNQAMRGDWSGAFDTLKTAIGTALIDMGDNILTAWASIWENVKSLVTGIDWGATAQSVMTFLGSAISGAVEFLGDIAGMIKGWVESKLGLESGASWGTIGQKVLDLITDGIVTAIETVSGVASEVISWLLSSFESTGDTDWLEVGTSILSGIFNTFSSLGKSFTEIVVALIKGINDMMTAEQFKTLVDTLLDKIVIAIGAIVGGLLTIAVALINGIALGLLGADSWGEVADNIIEMIEAALEGREVKVKVGPDASWGNWNPLDPEVWEDTIWFKGLDKLGELGNNPVSSLSPKRVSAQGATNATQSLSGGKKSNTQQYDTMATEATTGMNKVNQAIRAGYEAIRTTFTQMESNMIRLMTQIMTKLEQPVTSGMLTLNQRFRTGYEDIRTTFEQMGRNMERLMKQALTKVETAVNENMGNVVTAFRSKISQVTEAGRNTGQGFYNGLHSQRSRIVNLANDIAQSVIDTMEDALDINSPSGETEWIADMTIAGLVNNMKAGIQRVRNTTAQVADAMLFNPQEVDFNFGATAKQETTQVTQTEYMLDELIQLTKQLVDKDSNLYVEGQVFGEVGAKHINRYNETQELRRKRIQGGTL